MIFLARYFLISKRVLILVLANLLIFNVAYAAPFSHDNQFDWKYLAVACGNGKRQSPIDLSTAKDNKVPLLIAGINVVKPLKVDINDKTINVWLEGDYVPQIKFASVDYSGYLWNIHAPSEHVIGDVTYPMEGQLIMRSAGANPKYLIVSVFFKQGFENNTLKSILAKVSKGGESKSFSSIVSFSDLLPSNLSSFYHYTGSFTSPIENYECKEDVTWIVFTTPINASMTQIATVKGLYDNLPNNRSVQALNGREVFISK